MESSVRLPGAAQESLERFPEVWAPAVNNWVKYRVHITQPVQEQEELVRDEVPVEDIHYVGQEKGQPAQGEGAHDDTQGL